MSSKLTVIIPCKNEQANVRACVESARLVADEILVADSGSTDNTLSILREMGGCRIVEREYVHSGDFKNWAIPQAAADWVFILDADERITPHLADEIRTVLSGESTSDGYWVYRDNYFMGHPIRHSGWGNDRVLRLFRRDLGRYVGDTDHAEVAIATGRVGRLHARLTHYTFWTYDQYLLKIRRYANHQASVWRQQGRRPSGLDLVFRGPLRFLRTYFFQLGFLDGMAGFQVCLMQAFYSYMKQARLWELWNALPQGELRTKLREPTVTTIAHSQRADSQRRPPFRAAS